MGLRQNLNRTPDLLADLDLTITRQDQLVGKSGRGGGESALPFKPAASEARWVLVNVLTTWVRVLHEETGITEMVGPVCRGACVHWSCATVTRTRSPRTPEEAAVWLGRHYMSIALHPAGGEAVDEIADAVAAGVRAIDRPVDTRTYLGMCGDPAGRSGCQGRVYARPNRDQGFCDTCDTSHSVDYRRAVLVRSMATQRITALEISQILPKLGVELTVRQIQNAGRAGLIVAVSTDRHGKRRYLVWDVLRALLTPEALAALTAALTASRGPEVMSA
jgi:hypothetical protein